MILETFHYQIVTRGFADDSCQIMMIAVTKYDCCNERFNSSISKLTAYDTIAFYVEVYFYGRENYGTRLPIIKKLLKELQMIAAEL